MSFLHIYGRIYRNEANVTTLLLKNKFRTHFLFNDMKI